MLNDKILRAAGERLFQFKDQQQDRMRLVQRHHRQIPLRSQTQDTILP